MSRLLIHSRGSGHHINDLSELGKVAAEVNGCDFGRQLVDVDLVVGEIAPQEDLLCAHFEIL